MRYFLMALSLILSLPSVAQTEKTKQQWLAEAQAAGEKLFKNYHAICNGKVFVRGGDSYFHEFSGSKAVVEVFGLYRLSEADKLNGKLWSGKMEVSMGKSARSIEIASDGTKKVSEWDYGREAEFDFVFADGQWKIVDDKIYANGYLKQNVTCSDIGL